MQRNGFDVVGFLVWSGLVLFSLRPLGAVERVTALAVSPLRFAAELTAPLTLLRRREVAAAEARLVEQAPAEAAANELLLADLARFARPSDPALLRGRRLVHAEVRGRATSRDRLEVWLASDEGIVPGLPVACGDAYVGRVVGVHAAGSPVNSSGRVLAEVELVTARDFQVGARVPEGPAGAPVTMTVGGVDAGAGRLARARREVRLAVHNPSDRELDGGFAIVHELFAEADPFGHLSAGLHLGRVRKERSGRWTIVPELDYVDGLTHVVVLAEGSGGETEPPTSLLFEPGWVEARPLGLGDPSPWREATKLDVGAAKGVRVGAAVTAIGARFVGRIERVTRWSADVSFLGDRGFHVVAIARVAGVEAPQVLGRLVSLGRDPVDGAVLFAWTPRVDLELGGATAEPPAAELFTGSGDDGRTSGGFYLGLARLPARVRAGETYVVRLAADVVPRDVRTLFVRADGVEGDEG